MSGTPYLRLESERSRVLLAPALGGAVAAFDTLDGAPDGMSSGLSGATPSSLPGGTPVLRRAPEGDAPAFALACNLLLPFSNRLSEGGFVFDGVRHRVEPNLEGEPLPIHGDAFQRAWAVESASAGHARLRLEDGRIGPYRYRATVDYTLVERALTARLAVTHLGADPLPYGGGFHPWFPRTAGTSVAFDADGVWLEDERHLPSAHRPLAERPAWCFEREAPLPPGWINNAFTGWGRRACIRQRDSGLRVTLHASDALDTLIVHSPGHEADFFCLEPVSHAVDAHHASGMPGLVVLRTGESLTLSTTIVWSRDDDDAAATAITH